GPLEQGRTCTLLGTQRCARSEVGLGMWRGGESPVRSGARSRPVKRPSRARPPPSRLPQAAVLTTTTDFEVTPIRPTIAIQDHLSESRLRSMRPTRARTRFCPLWRAWRTDDDAVQLPSSAPLGMDRES